MKRPEAARAIPAGEPNAPAISEHDAIMEDARSMQRRGFLIGGFGCLAALGAVGHVLYRATQKGPPVQIADVCRGDVVAMRTATMQPTRPSLEAIGFALNRWVRGAREVSVDQVYWRRELDVTYAMTKRASQADEVLSAFHRRTQPNEAAKERTVKLDQQTALPAQGNPMSNTWNLEWREIAKKRDGALISVGYWKMEITFELMPPSDDAAELSKNLYGIYVTFFSWQQVPAPNRGRLAEARP